MAKEDKRESGKEVLRLFRLDALLQTDKYYSKEQLADLLDVSIPTVDRDIKRLREDWQPAVKQWSGTTTFLRAWAGFLLSGRWPRAKLLSSKNILLPNNYFQNNRITHLFTGPL